MYDPLKNRSKIIGTLVPLSALTSAKNNTYETGTFTTGLIFLDWLKKTYQSAWQLLPLHETQLEPGSASKHVPSPYKSYCIGLDPKYLPESFAGIYPSRAEKNAFLREQNIWLPEYALFCALRDHFQTDDWRQWDKGLKNRDKATLTFWIHELGNEIDKHIILQWQLHTAYTQLRKKAKELGIILIGDLPFYPSLQSPLVWANQDVFQIEKDGDIQFVSGTPDGPAAHFGRQVWGHPLYNWKQKVKVVAFWKMRLRYQATLFDNIRLDHAKAFFAYGVMDIHNEQNDRYQNGPGVEVFKKLIKFSRQNNLSVFAEDSGESIQDLRIVLKDLEIPGIKIFRFGLMEKVNKLNIGYADTNNYSKNTIAYTTTHDTETLLSYLQKLTSEQKQKLAETVKIVYDRNNKKFAKAIRRALLESPAHTVIIPIQDWLLTTDRINIPGTELPTNDPNWRFHLKTPIEKLPSKLS